VIKFRKVKFKGQGWWKSMRSTERPSSLPSVFDIGYVLQLTFSRQVTEHASYT